MARKKQVVIVKKTHPKAKSRWAAGHVARRYADRLYTVRETSTSFRFRQRPPDCFAKSSFKTAQPTKYVSVVYGEVKKSQEKRHACQ